MRIKPAMQVSLLLLAAAALGFGAPARAELREFHIITVHYDGKTNPKPSPTHGAEAYPAKPFESTNGMWVKGPESNGDWTVRAFTFNPSHITVMQGDEVKLHFVGIQGGSHKIVVDGVKDSVTVKRGTVMTVSFKAEKPGIITYNCVDHAPSMRGQVVVMPKN